MAGGGTFYIWHKLAHISISIVPGIAAGLITDTLLCWLFQKYDWQIKKTNAIRPCQVFFQGEKDFLESRLTLNE